MPLDPHPLLWPFLALQSVLSAWPIYLPVLLTAVDAVLAWQGGLGSKPSFGLAAVGAGILMAIMASAFSEVYTLTSTGSWWIVGAVLAVFVSLPGAGIALGRLLGRLRIKGRRAAWPAACYAVAVAYGGLLVLLSLALPKSTAPPDQALLEMFTQHRSALESIAVTARDTYLSASVTQARSSYQSRSDAPVSPRRFRSTEDALDSEREAADLHALLAPTGLWGFRSRDDRATFPVWADGSLLGGEVKGLMYRTTPPRTLTASLDGAGEPGSGRSAYRHIEGNWYLYRRWDSGTQYLSDRAELIRHRHPMPLPRHQSTGWFVVGSAVQGSDHSSVGSSGRLIGR